MSVSVIFWQQVSPLDVNIWTDMGKPLFSDLYIDLLDTKLFYLTMYKINIDLMQCMITDQSISTHKKKNTAMYCKWV